jgi:hypothetical protein
MQYRHYKNYRQHENIAAMSKIRTKRDWIKENLYIKSFIIERLKDVRERNTVS